MPNIYYVEKIESINPFSSDGLYGERWVGLSITDSAEYKMMSGTDILFGFKISRHSEGWQFRAMDFIEFNSMLGRNIIYTGNVEDLETAKTVYNGHSIYDQFLRPYEPCVLVHSTTPEGYRGIIKDGALKSWNKIKKGHDDRPIGALLGDPADFSDYVMLGELGYWSEIVVSSNEKGTICMDPDCDYQPGARFYFDTLTLIKEGLFVRDGMHYKVKDELPLSYAVFCATPENITIDGRVTPRSFADAADEAFKKGLT